MRVNADRESCIGSGQCVLDAPDVFDQDDDGVVSLKTAPRRQRPRRTSAGRPPCARRWQ